MKTALNPFTGKLQLLGSSSFGGSATFATLGGAPGDNAALAAALAAKLDKAGGTMTGALTLPAGSVSAPSLLLTGAGSTTGVYSTGSGSIDIAIAGVRRYWFDGLNLNTSGTGLQVTNGDIIGTFAYLRTNTGGALSLGASDDVKLGRGGAAATLQLGANHATTPTAQTLKAHNVTTGTGADLVLTGGAGSANGGMVKLSNVSGDVRMSVGDDGVGFFTAAPQPQATTFIAGSSHTPGSGTGVTDDSTFDGYTIPQIVAGLRTFGLFA